MNPPIRIKTTPALLITLSLLCFGILPRAQAVLPPPDGGYPGFNTAEGQNALFSLTTGAGNTAVGWSSLRSDTTAGFNTGVGAGTLLANTGDQNTATGAAALISNLTGTYNTANGALALRSNNVGNLNTAVGWNALPSNTTGSGNTALGFNAGSNITTAESVIAIGSPAGNVSTSCFIGNVRGVTTANPDAIPVLIDSVGQLGTQSSSRRYKKEIRPMHKASESLLALKPVSFHYKSDNTQTPQFGLIAEEVAEVNPDLVVRDEKGEIYTVRYDAVNAMLLNEFLKAHRTVQEQKATIAQLKSTDAKQEATIGKQQKQIEALIAGLQRVSDQLELSKAAPQTVKNTE
jgi:Chaperone of endosialidase